MKPQSSSAKGCAGVLLVCACALALLTAAAARAGIREWTPRGPLVTHVLDLAMDPQQARIVYAATADGQIRKTTDGGLTWNVTGDSGLGSSHVPDVTLAIDPQNPATLYAASGCAVAKSVDGGDSWTLVETNLQPCDVSRLAIDPDDPATLYAGSARGVWRSDDGGASGAGVHTSTDGGHNVRVVGIDRQGGDGGGEGGLGGDPPSRVSTRAAPGSRPAPG